jgi:hypothetical protein
MGVIAFLVTVLVVLPFLVGPGLTFGLFAVAMPALVAAIVLLARWHARTHPEPPPPGDRP